MNDFVQAKHDRRLGYVALAVSCLVFATTVIYTPIEYRHLTRYSAGGDAGFAQLGDVLRLVLLTAPAGMLAGIVFGVMAVVQLSKRAVWLLVFEVLFFVCYCTYVWLVFWLLA